MKLAGSVFFAAFVALLISCAHHDLPDPLPTPTPTPADPEPDTLIITDWTEPTHGKVDPNYEQVLPQDKVNTLEIRIKASDWTAIQSNMKELFGFGFGESKVGMGFPDTDPAYVPVSLKCNGLEWYKVGFRLKGNSSLLNSWSSGVYKLPFRLNFDRFEDEYPLIKNQRFYGFKELSMSPGFKDRSLMREKVASDVFRMAGIQSSQTAFYKVFIDFGSGSMYCGVYTMVEVVDDTMVKHSFGGDHGNVYKPESKLLSFVADEFEKRNNENEGDFDDVEDFVEALNSNVRLTNPAVWRAALENKFDVDYFIKWLAVNTTMMNWDTYGQMAHNYYLYHHPTNELTWIPWDNNEALTDMNTPSFKSLPLSLSTVESDWPLIRFIADDPVYFSRYKGYVREFDQQIFTSPNMDALFDRYYALISPYVVGPEQVEQGKYSQLTSPQSFPIGVNQLKAFVQDRTEAVEEFLD